MADVLSWASHTLASLLAGLSAYRDSLGGSAFAVFFAIEVGLLLIMLPVGQFIALMGFVFGFLPATLIGWSALLLGLTIDFLLGRHCYSGPCVRCCASSSCAEGVRRSGLGARARAWLKRYNIVPTLVEALRVDSCLVICAVRLNPFFPAGLTSAAFGCVPHVRLRDFVAGTAAGTFPDVCAWAYLGTLLGSVTDLASSEPRHTPATDALLIATALVSLAVLVRISRSAAERLAAAAGVPASSALRGNGGKTGSAGRAGALLV